MKGPNSGARHRPRQRTPRSAEPSADVVLEGAVRVEEDRGAVTRGGPRLLAITIDRPNSGSEASTCCVPVTGGAVVNEFAGGSTPVDFRSLDVWSGRVGERVE